MSDNSEKFIVEEVIKGSAYLIFICIIFTFVFLFALSATGLTQFTPILIITLIIYIIFTIVSFFISQAYQAKRVRTCRITKEEVYIAIPFWKTMKWLRISWSDINKIIISRKRQHPGRSIIGFIEYKFIFKGKGTTKEFTIITGNFKKSTLQKIIKALEFFAHSLNKEFVLNI